MVSSMEFFNREDEIKKIVAIMGGEPQRINFIFGPINSGKTTLINEIINNKIDNEKYIVFYINLRGKFISGYEDFLKVLFSVKNTSLKEIFGELLKSGLKYKGIPISENLLDELIYKKKKDIFEFLTDYFEDIVLKGKKPIMIIDELQVIGDLKINGFLIYKLFNFFIDLTKEKHLAHVFCLSSDSLFIEKVYNEAMLDDRADYILIDDFDKETAMGFIDFLTERSLNKKLSNEEKETIHYYVGGKPILIINVIDKLKIGYELNDILNELLTLKISQLKDFLRNLDYITPKVMIENIEVEINKKDILNALKLFKENYTLDADEIPKAVYVYLIEKNILFLNPMDGSLNVQSYLMWNAIKKVVKSI